jgi:surface polysaccharide O-acyltransferase-like enzyme
MTLTKTSSTYLDVLRMLACFAVIMLHYSGSYNYRFGIPTFDAGIQFFTITRWCVPVFLMISGALLLGKDEDLPTGYRKRFSRVLPAFFTWSAIYIIVKLITGSITKDMVPDAI